MKFKSYDKVSRIEKEECEGILKGNCYIFEKIDGANAQISFDQESGRIVSGSRHRVLSVGDNRISGDDFRGFVPYVLERERQLIREFFSTSPSLIIFGEWLVPHKVKYAKEAYNKFYAFDFSSPRETNKDEYDYFCWGLYHHDLFKRAGIEFIPLDVALQNPTMEILESALKSPSSFGASFREGIVIKNYGFVNKWGRCTYGKLLSKDYQEVKHKSKIELGESIESQIADIYATDVRAIKIMQKIEAGEYSFHSGALTNKQIPVVMELVYKDIIEEDILEILKKFKNPKIDFKKLKSVVSNSIRETVLKGIK